MCEKNLSPLIFKIIGLISIAFFSLFSLTAHSTGSTDDQLQIRVYEPDLFKTILQDNRSVYIALEGVIDSDAPSRLKQVLSDPRNKNPDVFFHSPGGSLLAGVKIGRLLRQYGANTNVGKISFDRSAGYQYPAFAKFEAGTCKSA